MGLDAVVGAFQELDLDDDGRYEQRRLFKQLSIAVSDAGLPEYREPEDLTVTLSWSARIGGYDGLHHLRRIAAHLWDGRDVPEPIEDDAAADPILDACYNRKVRRPFLKRLFSPLRFPGKTYAHLLDHSDCEGYYLPLDFSEPLVPRDDLEIAGGWIGSSVRLLAECEQLAEAMSLSLDLDPESEDFDNEFTSPPRGGPLWRRHAIASYVCLQLIAGAKASIRAKASLIFC